MTYAELQVTTHYSFLRGASSCEELFATAALMGMPALGITDRNSVAGVVRALVASEQTKVHMVAGCRLDLVDGTSLLVWPEDRPAWSRLTRLLTLGKSRADPQHGEKGKCFLHWEDVAEHAEGLVGALVPGFADSGDPLALRWMADVFAERGHVTLTQHRRPGDALRIHTLAQAARHHGLTPLATGDVLYHHPDKRMLQDMMTAIREKCTIDELGFRRERSADRHLKPPEEMARRFKEYPEALRASAAIVERCTFSLRSLDYQYPDEIFMTRHTPQKALERMAWRALNARHNGRPRQAYRHLLTKELTLVQKLGYAPYFLTVLAIVEFARSQHILCQGRGSAANSLICFLLGVTSIDPVKNQLLFERFVSEERDEPPDIDIDFEHERREEVIQWIYETYGHDHAALTAVVSRYRSRGALREVGKAMGLPEDLTAALSSQVWGTSNDVDDGHAAALNLDRSDARLALTLELARQLVGTPRHLSQHPGGFVLTRDRLDTLVPIEPAAMVDRRVVEWEKLDVEELGLMKVDVLGLGMLGCMRRAFTLLEEHKNERMTLDADVLQGTDPPTFEMIQRADTLGVFQIESRAQMSMLPRMLPTCFYDIAIQVAIVRPGPIQGNMVHPYLKRRELLRNNPKAKIDYPSPALETVLTKTLGIPLFQEQAMQVAIKGADFTPAEADRLRHAMATFKSSGDIGEFGPKLIAGMRKNGISEEFAERMVEQIKGFSNYGFPESHAASFAKIAYASSWMKCHHPDVFCTALLNAQPMGFYAPAQLIRDARTHGVEARAVCINDSDWDTRVVREGPNTRPRHVSFCGSEADWARLQPIRLGMRIVLGLAEADVDAILGARAKAPFVSIEDVWRRSRVKPAALERLARADAFHALGLNRRQALWAIKGLGQAPLDLFAAADAGASVTVAEAVEPKVALLPLTAGSEVVEDYRATQLTLRAHPITFLRDRLDTRRIARCGDLSAMKDGDRAEVAGLILVRQRPGSAKGVVFVTLEDETGIANAVLWADRFEANRRTVMSATMLAIRGKVQREGIVIHLVAEQITDLTPWLRELGELDLPRMTMPGDGATHGGTIDPRDQLKLPRQRALESWPPRRSLKDTELIPIRSHDFH
ncbi:error-prone DNA polymerase [Sphingomonas sp. JC676]|uniref:error-prone DNA polymerase n=1 Tax=Sphingomonas sp. JC676 TaxID=2768065 RepID=UPI001657859C|nr:error-prone DNA polymerase [Sphingomonas sp. JC676]MBC9033352.1 error-prone DNA polymerase [Sphingomonas sp. JC676]